AVYFRHLHVVSLRHQNIAEQFGGEQRALPADADNHNAFYTRHHTCTSEDLIAPKLHSFVHKSHPTHSVSSMTTRPSVMLIAGHPMRIHALHVLHFSSSSTNGGACLTYLSSTHGLRAMMTDGSSASSSSRTTCSSSFSSFGSTTRTRRTPAASQIFSMLTCGV